MEPGGGGKSWPDNGCNKLSLLLWIRTQAIFGCGGNTDVLRGGKTKWVVNKLSKVQNAKIPMVDAILLPRGRYLELLTFFIREVNFARKERDRSRSHLKPRKINTCKPHPNVLKLFKI